MSAEKPSRLAVTGVLAFLYLPWVATLVILGWKLGWRAPVALIAGTAVFAAKVKLDVRRKRAGLKPIPWQIQMLVLIVIGTAIGGVLLGAFGFFMGLIMGLGLGLPPVSVKNRDGVLVPVDTRDPAQWREINKAVLLMVGVPCVFAVVFVVGLLVSRFA